MIDGEAGLKRAFDGLCRRASLAIKSGYTLLILSDRGIDEEFAPIPSLLALTAVHNHLVREGYAHRCCADRRIWRAAGSHALSLLIGYGASAINPYLAIETIEELVREQRTTRRYLRDGGKELQKGYQQRAAESLFKDGHLDAAELPRRPGV